jgi:hypothetical protein
MLGKVDILLNRHEFKKNNTKITNRLYKLIMSVL